MTSACRSGDNLSLALGTAGLLTALIFHNRFRDAAHVASDFSATLDSMNEPALTLTLCVAASNAKWQAGEVVEALRLAQRAIDLAEGDPTQGRCDYRLPVDAGPRVAWIEPACPRNRRLARRS